MLEGRRGSSGTGDKKKPWRARSDGGDERERGQGKKHGERSDGEEEPSASASWGFGWGRNSSVPSPEGRGGCCTVTYGGGGGGERRVVAWKLGWIMLRFRPIVPKPVPTVGAPPVAARAMAEGRKARRARRKASSGGGGREGRRGRLLSSSESSAGSGSIMTLPLMPETPKRKEAAPPSGIAAMPYVIPAWVRAWEGGKGGCGGGEVVAPRPGAGVLGEQASGRWSILKRG